MPEPTARAENTVTLDTSPSKAMTTLYGAAIGPISSDYYLPLFERFEAAGRGTVSWNGYACLYNLNWMIFRGLWGVALALAGALVGAALVLVALGRLVFDWPPELLYGSLLGCLALVFLVPGVWGNALYYNHCRAAMMTAVANNKTLVQACAELGQHASSRTRFLRILAVNAALIALVGAAAMMLMRPSDNQTVSLTPGAAPAEADTAQPANVVAPAAAAASPTASAAASTASAAEPAASATESPASAAALVASAPVEAASASSLSMMSSASAAPQVLPAVSAPAQASSTAVSAPAVVASKETPLPQPTAHIKAKSTASAPAQTEGIYVNAGLFADPDNAHRTVARLIAVGLPASAQELHTSHGTRIRVRVGPFANRNRAELAVRHIKAMNLDAVLAKP